jgi:CRP/FNR family transcriptional regulator
MDVDVTMNESIQAAQAVIQRLAEPCAHCDARHLSVCKSVDDPDLEQLAALVVPIQLQAKSTMVAEGDKAAHYFNITSGTVKIYKLLPDGRQQIVGFSFAGDFVGLSVRDTYAYTVEALTESRACRFDRKKLEGLLAKFPKMEHQLRSQTSDELAIAQDQMLLLGRKTAKERVASFLLQLSARAKRLGQPDNPIVLTMGRADMGDYLGLTIETVSRTFTKLRAEKLITLGAGNAVRLDIKRLEEVAGAWG